MTKNAVMVILTVVILFLMTTTGFASGNDIKIVLNGESVYTDVSPVIINGRTMVPARSVFEKMGATVTWDGAIRRVTVVSKEHVISLTIDNQTALVNGIKKQLDTPPCIINGRTLVPVRFISESLGFDVEWHDKDTKVIITGSFLSPPPGSSQENPEQNTGVNENSSSDQKDSVQTEAELSVKSVNVSKLSDGAQITLALSENITPKIMTLDNPRRLVFDFYGATLKIPNSSQSLSGSEVKEVRWGAHPEYCRIVVECKSDLNYELKYNSSGCVITVSESVITSSVEELETTKQPSGNVTPVNPDKKPLSSDKSILVCIDPGHGGHDSGAVGRDEEGETVVVEKEANLKISLKVRDLLVSSGVDVMMTREKDVALGTTQMEDLVKRASMANEKNAHLFVSIHNNAFSDSDATGTTVLYAGLATSEDYGISGKELAQNIQTPLAKATGLKDRGLVRSPGMVVLKRTAMPAVIVECAFVTCEEDQKVLTNPKKIDDIAYAIYEGIMKSLSQIKSK